MIKTYSIHSTSDISIEVRALPAGAAYGLNGCRTAERPMVQFYSGEHLISYYYADTIIKSKQGLMLDGSAPQFNISADTMRCVRAFLKGAL